MSFPPAIARVLAGEASYDDLPEDDQEVVRAEWERRLAASLGSDRTERLVAGGVPWAEADDDGNLVMRKPEDFE